MFIACSLSLCSFLMTSSGFPFFSFLLILELEFHCEDHERVHRAYNVEKDEQHMPALEAETDMFQVSNAVSPKFHLVYLISSQLGFNREIILAEISS